MIRFLRASLCAALVSAVAISAAPAALADVGPPPRQECVGADGPCWIDGKLPGTCVEGVCRYGVPAQASAAPSASASSSASGGPASGGPAGGCATESSARSRYSAGLVMLGVAVALAIARRSKAKP